MLHQRIAYGSVFRRTGGVEARAADEEKEDGLRKCRVHSAQGRKSRLVQAAQYRADAAETRMDAHLRVLALAWSVEFVESAAKTSQGAPRRQAVMVPAATPKKLCLDLPSTAGSQVVDTLFQWVAGDQGIVTKNKIFRLESTRESTILSPACEAGPAAC